MVRSLNAAFIAFLLAFCSVVANADTKAPEIIPEPAIPAVLKELSPLNFRAQDDSDAEPDLVGYGLIDGEGAEIPGVSAVWGKRCPDGFVPSINEGVCTKTQIVPKTPVCQDGFDLVQNSQSVDVCRRVDTIPAKTACPEDYALSADGGACELFESRAAGLECPAEWTLEESECFRILEEPPVISCPDGYDRSGSECSRVVEVPPADECPAGSEVNGNECSTLDYQPAEACPRGKLRDGRCYYDIGAKEAAKHTPEKEISCERGYTADNSEGVCRKRATGTCKKYKYKSINDPFGGSDIRGCGVNKKPNVSCPKGTIYRSVAYMGGACFLKKDDYECPANYRNISMNSRACESNAGYPPLATKMVCKTGWFGPNLEYGSGKCWYKDSYFIAQCPGSFSKNIEESFTGENYSQDDACVSGGTVTKGGLCEEGFSFNGETAVCAAVEKVGASAMCPEGYSAKGLECKKIIETSADFTCPDGFSVKGKKCVKKTVRPEARCPAGYVDTGETCTQTTKIQPESTYSCPSGTIPQYCSFNGLVTQWMGNFGDEKLSVSDQRTACENYTKGSLPGVFTPIRSSTQCSTPFKQTSGPGYHCSEGNYKICAPTEAAQHRLSWGNDAQPMWTNSTCPVGYSLQGDMCVKEDILEKCPQGWSQEGEQCVIRTSIDLQKDCPDGYVADGEICRQITYKDFDYSCPEGSTLQGQSCFQVNESGPYTGDGCPEGEIVFGGSCQKSESTPVSEQCPSGYEMTGSSCQKTKVDPASYTCGEDSTWSLQSTTCWRVLTEPSLIECPDGSWVQQGGQCTRTTDDVVQRECPEGYDQSSEEHSECVKTEVVDDIQGNQLTVTIPKVWPGSYTLNLSVRDDAGNVGSEEFNINYAPDLLALRSGDAKLSMPAVQHAYKWKDGAATLVTHPIEVGNTVLSGSRPIYAGVSAKAETGYNFAGVNVKPGEYKEIIPSYDFDKSEGSLEFPMYPLSGEASTSDIVVSVGGDGEIASVIEVTAWTFSGEAEPTKNPVMQLFEELAVEAGVSEGTPCSLTGQTLTAQSESALDNPYCLIEWTDVPAPLSEQGRIPRLQGKFNYEGVKTAGYSAYLIDSEGERIKVGEGITSFDVKKAFGSFDWQFQNDVSPIMHTVEELSGRLQQVDGPNCRLTVDEDRAIAYAQRGYVGQLCYLKWFDLPGTLDQAPHKSQPWLGGRVYSAGHYDVGYRVFAYTSLGVPVMISEQKATIEAIDPPPPSVEFINGNKINDSLYEAGITGDRLASAHIQSKNADLAVAHKVDGKLIEKRSFPSSPWSSEFATYQRVSSVATKLWEKNTHTVTASYIDLQEISASDTIETLAVPDEDIGPTLISDAEYVLNEDTIPLAIRIGNLYRADVKYDPEVMGEWEVRAVRQISYNEYEPITGWIDHDSEGKAYMSLDLAELGVREGYVRIYAEARVKSPTPDFSRTKRSGRPLFLKVLFGGEIDASVDGDQMSGPVPFRGVFRLGLKDRGLARALGAVQWQISEDDGATWTDRENRARNNRYLDMTIEEPGTYLIRANLKNRNSSIATQTPPVEVIAYRKPEVVVDWKSDVFVGEEIILDSTITLNGQEVSADAVDIEWSNDAGKTFKPGGLKHTFERTTDPTSARRERWEVRVKTPNAPADDPIAWTVREGSINYKEVRGPRIYIRGPRILELGNTYKFNVYRAMPYLRMEYEIDGYFTMPDGTEVYGDTVMYTPTEEDLEERYIKLHYTGWIVGWKDKGAINTDDQGVRIWEYEFPEFAISGRYSAGVVPIEATLYTRPRTRSGRLEEPVYEWDIPEGIEVIEDVNPIARRLIIHEPGKFEINVKVTDARMNEGRATETIEAGVPEDYELSMRLTGSNEFNRAPYEIVARPDIEGGHPRDRVEEYNYTVDGEPMELFGRYGRAILEAGDHTVRLEIFSEFGKVAAVEKVVTAYENKPPVCNLEVRDGTFRFTVRNRCDDPDGRVRNYKWWVDGEPLNLTGYQVSMTKKESGKELVVEGQGIDDSGLISEKQKVRIQMPDPKPEDPST